MIDLLRSTAFRWALGIALWSALLVLGLFAFVYWQTAGLLQEELTETLELEIRTAAVDPAAAATRVNTWIATDVHATHFGGLFGADGARLSGNIRVLPAGLARDGQAHRVKAEIDIAQRMLHDETWAAALPLADGGTVVIAHDTDEIDQVQRTTLRALGLGLVPTLAFSIVGGALLANRARRRLAATEAALAQVMRGDLRQRLPVGTAGDEFDRLAGNVNRMLDEIERLMDEVRGVGDAVAHDLRTPLTRLRARLERSREEARSVAEFRDVVDQGLAWLDQTLAMVTAVLRIGEIEHGRRRAGFAPLDLALVVREAAEFFEPVAQDKGVSLVVTVDATVPRAYGDRDLLFEAVSNLIENAVKFTPSGGRVGVGLTRAGTDTVIIVEDTGPGVPAAEREQVFRRFYRAERARQTPGNGLGLGLVAAIVALHGFSVTVTDGPGGGARFVIACPPGDPRARQWPRGPIARSA